MKIVKTGLVEGGSSEDGPWRDYILSSKVHPHLFYRDTVHANEPGEQILSKILMAFWKQE